MDRALLAYLAYMLFFALLLGGIFITPILAFSRDMGVAYMAFSYTCHQKISRSLCLFSDGSGYWVGDCTPQKGVFVDTVLDREQIKVDYGNVVGYKMPVCSRDIGIYLFMFLGGLAYPFVRRIDSRYVYPAIYLVLAMVPLGIDGTVQLVSDLGLLPFVYESTNELRLITGAITGLAAAFYAIPILVNFFAGPEDYASDGWKSEGGRPASVDAPAGAEEGHDDAGAEAAGQEDAGGTKPKRKRSRRNR